MKEFYDNLRTLTQLRGVSGMEDQVRDAILKMIDGHCSSWRVDATGNLIVEKKGASSAARKLFFSAHMDEVGFVVTHIQEDGLLRFAPVGGVLPAVAAGRPVLVGERALPGTIGVKPIHLLSDEERDKYAPLDDMLIDIGASSREKAMALVAPGEQVTFVGEYREMGDGCIASKAIDDRAGCALLVEMIRSQLPCDCTFAFTCQEESGCLGGGTAAFGVAPDIGIAVEGTTAGDIPSAPDHKKACFLRKGPVLSYRDRGTAYDHHLYEKAAAAAQRAGIPWQTKEGIFGGNESRSVQAAGPGVKVLALSVPVRYIHSAHSMAARQDLEDAFHLLMELTGALGL